MKVPSDRDLEQLWATVVDPAQVGMVEALAREIAEYTGEAPAEVRQKMATGTADLKALWTASGVNGSDCVAVESFYHDQFVEAYELANWHAGQLGTMPLNYARAAWIARELGLGRVLDFGSGIGTGSICFATVGCEVHSADIARQLLKFVEHRMRRRGFVLRTIDLSGPDRPLPGYYDMISCFDVLEHVLDQFGKLKELSTYLRPGGYLAVNFFETLADEDRPMHVSSAGDWLALVRRTSLVPAWPLFGGAAAILQKTSFGRFRNAAAAVRERFQGTTSAGLRRRDPS